MKLIQEIKASMGIFEGASDGAYGMLAEFPHPGALLHAAEETRKAGYRRFDAHSPFPVHGMDEAMGLGNSKVGFFTFAGGLTGCLGGALMMWWMGAVDYPINISGKPFFAIEPSVPIMFELTIVVAAVATVGAMLALNGLPRPYNPLFYSERFSRATDDSFFIHIAASDAQFDREETASFLRDLGAEHVELIYEDEAVDA
jgi:hypothetical protein